MFCDQCGNPLNAGARFCSACGAAVGAGGGSATLPYAHTAADQVADEQPLMVLRPRFIGWVTAMSVVPIQLFMTVWAGGFCGGFSTAGVQGLKSLGLGSAIPSWFPFVFFACLAFFGIPGVVYLSKKRSYARTEYRFFADRLEYFEGFLTIQQKTIDYRFVQEVTVQKGLVQRRYGLGTIVLATPATGTESGTSRSGIRVADVEDPDTVYEEVRRLVREAQKRAR